MKWTTTFGLSGESIVWASLRHGAIEGPSRPGYHEAASTASARVTITLSLSRGRDPGTGPRFEKGRRFEAARAFPFRPIRGSGAPTSSGNRSILDSRGDPPQVGRTGTSRPSAWRA